ncbi:MAG: polyphosphate kinase 1 [Cardiobacteriaceae bacterium]|nr:polyphosphate kinase 1 [Cardiobacteriaceae bacterium]
MKSKNTVKTTESANTAIDFSDFSQFSPQDIYLNRELTWLDFNRRVLSEAAVVTNPLLERVKFLAIVSSNLDEFFMKRIGGLKQQVAAQMTALSVDGRSAQEQIDACYAVVGQIEEELNEIWLQLHCELAANGIHILQFADLSSEEKEQMRLYFAQNIYPLLTPQAMDPAHPFPFVSNLSLNLLVSLQYPDSERSSIARVKIPVGQGTARFVEVASNSENPQIRKFLPLEDLILANLDLLFPEMQVIAADLFRVTRNAITEKSEDKAQDLLLLIKDELLERHTAPIVRLQYCEGILPVHKGMLAAELRLDEEKDTFASRTLALKDLFEIYALERADLKFPPHYPEEQENFIGEDNIFHAIRKSGPFLVQHPYESFSSTVERLLADAAQDPKVIGIKMTLYRTSADSKIIEHLLDASRNGKQVTVVVEVKARFDESANIRWAQRLEEAGIHITYGIVGLKTHSKLIYIIRHDYDGLRRYAHIGTGNYHSGTARQYADFGLFTADRQIGADLTELFNYLTTGYTPNRKYQKILPAPRHLKQALIDKIRREAELAKNGKTAKIRFKCNALEDKDLVDELYRASQAGVQIELLVRDTCRIVAGRAGLSENISVLSIVGRFLEHGRIYYFYNDGQEEFFIGSADLMHRNLESRVEVLVQIEKPELQLKLAHYLDVQFSETVGAWQMLPDGSYERRKNTENQEHCQEIFIKEAKSRAKSASQIRHRKTKSLT